MRIDIELSSEEYEPIKRMADYCHTTPGRIAEALLQGQASNGFLYCYADTNWLSVTEYLREIGEDTPRLKRIENYLEAAQSSLGSCKTIDDVKVYNSHFTSLETFEAWQAYNLEKH